MTAIRRFCFTLNNYDDDDIKNIDNLDVKFIMYGKEEGENGTPHLQGYCEIGKVVRFSTILGDSAETRAMKKKLGQRINKGWFNGKAHIEQCRGTQTQNIEYCSKQDTNPYRRGTPCEQGKRTDLDVARSMALTGGMREVSAVCKLQGIKCAETFLTYNEEPRDWKPHVVWIYGPAGVGKSRKARELCGEDNMDVYVKNTNNKWWNGYDAHEWVIMDDFRESWWDLTEMLSLLDRYEKRIEYKGGMRQFKAKYIYVTTIFAPDEMYRNDKREDPKQLLRRIDEIIHLVTDVTQVAGNTKTATCDDLDELEVSDDIESFFS